MLLECFLEAVSLASSCVHADKPDRLTGETAGMFSPGCLPHHQVVDVAIPAAHSG